MVICQTRFNCDVVDVIVEGSEHKVTEDVRHGSLLCRTCVLEAERHHCVAKGIPGGHEDSSKLMFWIDSDLVYW